MKTENIMKSGHMVEQGRLFLLAISFFTRIPVNLSGEVTPQMLNQASRYFALVGVLIGIFSWLVFAIVASWLPMTIAVLFSMAASVLLTGAFHEDGWADVWDGFGGGWGVENKLNIMKDSRLGTYGASGLFFILMLKYQALLAIAEQLSLQHTTPISAMLSVFVLGHCLSRAVGTSLIAGMPYVSEDANSKVKPLAQELSQDSYSILLLTGLIVMFFTLPLFIAMSLVLALVIIRWLLKKWFMQQLGGYTGDCLGAAQQLSEVMIYLTILVLAMEAL